MYEIPEWPFFLGEPGAVGLIRCSPEDFVVEEISRIQPGGEGSHLWLWVEKRSANTDWVSRELARAAKCAPRDVGYAGLKDRHAVTRQWFSVPAGDQAVDMFENIEIEGVSVLEGHRHTRKLKRGVLNGNRFFLRVREFAGDASRTGQRLEQIREHGVPNYFGPQRFGNRGLNVEKGARLLCGNVRLQRSKKSIYLSAIRSFLFNQVLAERVREGNWNSMLDGELAMLDGTQSIFPCDALDQDIEDRCIRLDIHPTGPMPGRGGTQPVGNVALLEQKVLQNWPELEDVLKAQDVKAARRALRLYPQGLEWDFNGSVLELTFALPPGSYATTVLREILVFKEADRRV